MLEVVLKKNEKSQEKLPDLSQREERANSNVGTATRLVISRNTVGKEKNLMTPSLRQIQLSLIQV